MFEIVIIGWRYEIPRQVLKYMWRSKMDIFRSTSLKICSVHTKLPGSTAVLDLTEHIHEPHEFFFVVSLPSQWILPSRLHSY